VTDSRVVVRHANGSWSFQTGRQMGRAAPPGRHGRAEGRYMPKAGKTSSTARGTTACRRGRGRTSSDRYLCVSMRVYAYEKELDRPMTEPLAELQGVPFGADGRLSCTYTQKFPANPGAGRDNRVIDQPVAAPWERHPWTHAMAVADQEIPEARRRLRSSGLPALVAAHRGEALS